MIRSIFQPWLMFAWMCAAVCAPGAEGNMDAETGNLSGWSGFDRISDSAPRSGRFCFHVRGYKEVISEIFIPVNKEKTYIVSAWLKSFGSDNSRVFLGVVPYDKNKERIQSQFVNGVKGTETVLLEPCTAGSNAIKVRNAEKWKKGQGFGVAFDIDASGKMADLPNNKVIMGIESITNENGVWSIKLTRNLKDGFPKGTAVREHSYGPSAIYVVSDKHVPQEWQEAKGTIKGMSSPGRIEPGKWWAGCEYARVMILVNYKQDNNAKLAVDDVKIDASSH
ncbi:MAG: hypothetical protein BWY31_00449 [Lentisphaerae bacterium ADurb.Bin242]|nr:MAG: hypothetical protein BWY31_00449 [Lentisphaerae bacterium ADurb.Bin242]